MQVSLQGAQEDLEETQYEKYVSDQKKLLDELYNEYELVLNQRLDNIDALISDMIAQINAEATGINATLVAQAESVGYTLSTEMSNIWNSSTGTNAVLSVYGDQIAGGVGTLNGTMTAVSAVISGINQNVQNMMASLNQIALSEATIAANSSASKTPATTPSSGSSSTTTPTPSPSTFSTPAKAPSSSSSSSSKPARTDKEYYGVALAIWNGNYGWGTGSTRVSRLKAKGFDANKVQNIVNQMGREGYVRSGAWVGKYYGITSLSPYHYNKFKLGAFDIPKSQLAWTQEGGKSEAIIRPSDGAILTPIKKGDSVLNGKATANLFGMMTDPGQFILDSLFDGKNITTTPSVCNNTNDFSVALENVNFNLPNVKNYDELLTAMQHDKNFERLIMSLTIDRLAGKSSLTKYQAIR